MSAKQLKSENEEASPAIQEEKVQSTSNVEPKMAAKSQGYNKKNIALISLFAFLVVGGIVGGLVYYFIVEFPEKYKEGRIQEFQTTGRECLVVSYKNDNQSISNKTEQCANKSVYSQILTLHVSNTTVTKVLFIDKIEYQLDNGTNYTLPGINLTDIKTTTMRFLQQNNPSQNETGDINQVPNAVIVTDKNDTVIGVGFPNNSDSNYRTAILQQVYNVQIDQNQNSSGLTNLGNLNASTDTPNKRIRILQIDENNNNGQSPTVNASQHASLDSNGNVNQSNITQSQQITQQNQDNSSTTVQGNSTSTSTCTQQKQASTDTLRDIQWLTAQQNISYYTTENISQAIRPASNQTDNNQTNSNQTSQSQSGQNPSNETNQGFDNNDTNNQTNQNISNQILSQEGNTSQNSSNRILAVTPQRVVLAQFSKSLVNFNLYGINFDAMADGSAILNSQTLSLEYQDSFIVNNQRIVLMKGTFSISTGSKSISKSVNERLNKNLINQVYHVFGFSIFLSLISQIQYGYTLQMVSPTSTQLQATYTPYVNCQLNVQAYASFFQIEIGAQARGDAKISGGFTVQANLQKRQSTANAVATIQSSLNVMAYFSQLRCTVLRFRIFNFWFSVPLCYKYYTFYFFNQNVFSGCKTLAIYSRAMSW